MQIDVLNQQGKKVSDISLNDAIFALPSNASLIAQAIRVRLTNARSGNANTQTRAEVSGGGRKPWRQKGTGRARHGSTRSPIWVGGGVSHGPRTRNPHLTMPQQMRRAALFISLSDKLRDKQVFVLDTLKVEAGKTSAFQDILQALPVGRSTLFVLPAKSESVERSTRNLGDVKVVIASVLHPYEILKYSSVIFLQDSLPVLEETFLKQTRTAKPEKKVATKQIAKETAKPAVKKEAKAEVVKEKKAVKPVAKKPATKAAAKDKA